MEQNLVGLAFAAGLVAALNPCGFAMLPAYLVLVVRGGGNSVPAAVGRAVAATATMTLGFLTVFGAFGLLTVSLASTVQRYMPFVTMVVGIVLVVLGIWLVSGRDLTLLVPSRMTRSVSGAPTSRLGSMFGYGVGYAVASLSCTVGPFLAVTGATLGGTSAPGRVWIYAAYAGGFALVVGALAVAVALASSTLAERIKRILPHVNRIGGAVVILVGLYVAYYGYYEVQLFIAGGDAANPVIAGAGRLQGAIAGWVHRHGAWPWMIVLAVSVVGASAWAWRVRRPRAGRAGADDGQ
ncbi:cytochrome c biogenesis CcdA family protein [Mycobacterium sp. Y57]|uniref:cytochrome c biogenesis CcdA family protein n=1 Tax=Mycolicibacterium xanthum TaxID=2796469 RepID=UPI001C8617BC|nr:cytochrome c biogenesis CcdA family protein [Mycolicibacterium xanthum]MBX7431860.1 cytochrome c biogenesis CcdA family protein [Mycolicibacterium xanthum]